MNPSGSPSAAPRHLVLVGMMGAGKSTIGRLCAVRLGRTFLDTDEMVEGFAGTSVAEVFAAEGEEAFRALERRAVADACARLEPLVVACGGGAVLEPANREALLATGFVVWLQAPAAILAARVGQTGGRPLLDTTAAGPDMDRAKAASDPDITEVLRRIAEEREPTYSAVSDIVLDATDGNAKEIAATVVRAYEDAQLFAKPRSTVPDREFPTSRSTRRIPVALGARSYEVTIGTHALDHLAVLLAGRRRVAIVTQQAVADAHVHRVLEPLERVGVTSEVFVMGDGEGAKTMATVEALCSDLVAWGLLRDDALVAFGGGIVGDTAGFAGAIYHRGIAVVQAPTTLLAQVDAAIGGKTAVNLPEGKNLLGAFHQPIGVVADVSTLLTLPEREYHAGLGEVAKYALMGDRPLLELLETRAPEVRSRDLDVLVELVAHCAEAKAAVVASDETEQTGLRATLNYGHTLAHALETASEHELLHGEAVAIGLLFAAALGAELGRVPAAFVERTEALLAGMGLCTRAPQGLQVPALVALMQRDKKARGGLTFILAGNDGLTRVDDPPMRAIERACAVVGVGG